MTSSSGIKPSYLIAGRFEYSAERNQLEVWFTNGEHRVLGAEDSFDKVLRYQVPIKLTGGEAARKSRLTWGQQLSGKLEAEADALLDAARSQGRYRKVPAQRMGKTEKIKLSSEEINDILGDLDGLLK